MRIIWALANLFSHWTAMSNADCWSHTKNPPLYTCAADIKIISFWVLNRPRRRCRARDLGARLTITAGERGEYGCILCLPVGITLTPLLFIIKIGLLAPMQGRKGLKCGFIIAPVTIVWETTGSSSYCEFPGTSIMLSFQTVFLFCTISS